MENLSKWKIGLTLLSMLFSLQAFAKENPYRDTGVKRLESSVVKEFQRFEFLESIATNSNGSIYTTNLFEGIIYQVKNNKVYKLADIDGMLAGLTILDDENLLVTGSNSQKEPVVLLVNTTTGEIKTAAKLPQALLLNGITKLNENTFLIADSFKGVIWKLNIKSGETSIWLAHDLLEKNSPEEKYPGVNGIKVFKNNVYISNTVKRLMVKIPLNEDDSAGSPQIIRENVLIDDFTLDHEGNIYGATNIYDSVIKITPQGEVSIVAQYDQGVAGSTCVTWEHGSSDTLLVSAHGGMLKPDKCDVTPAKIIKLKLK